MAEFRPLDDEEVKQILAQICEIANKLLLLIPESAMPPPLKLLKKIIEFLNTDAGHLVMREVLPYIVKAVRYVDKYIRQTELFQNANALLQKLAGEDELQEISNDLRKVGEKIQAIENKMNTLDEILQKPISEHRPLNNEEKRSFAALTYQLDASLKVCQGDLDHIREQILELEKKAKTRSRASTYVKYVSFGASALAVAGLWANYDKLTKKQKVGFGAAAAGCTGLGLGMHVIGEVMDQYKRQLSSIQDEHDKIQKRLDSLQEFFLGHQQAEKTLSL